MCRFNVWNVLLLVGLLVLVDSRVLAYLTVAVEKNVMVFSKY